MKQELSTEPRYFLGSRLVKTADLGYGDQLYGGRMLDFVAETAAVHAIRLTGQQHMAGYRFTEFYFLKPVKGGQVVDFHAGEATFGRTSVTFRVWAEVAGETVLRGECTFVAVDPDGRKVAISPNREET